MNIHLPVNVIRNIERKIFNNKVVHRPEEEMEVIILQSGEEVPLTTTLRKLSLSEQLLLKQKLGRQLWSSEEVFNQLPKDYNTFQEMYTVEEIIDLWSDIYL